VTTALEPLRGQFPTVRWMPAEMLHLTIVFLGQTKAASVPAIERRLGEVAGGHAPYEVVTGDASGRVDDSPGARRGGVAWLKLSSGAAQTAALSLDVYRALGSGTYDDGHKPRPHLTVARNVTPDALAALRPVAAQTEIRWRVDRIVLFRSHTGPRGSRYEELAASPLTSGRAGA
jgi:2'-5' RNA ligase